MARKLLLRQMREIKSLRKFSATTFLKKNDEFIVKSRLSDIVMPNMRLVDRLWLDFPQFKDHVAIVSVKRKYFIKLIIHFIFNIKIKNIIIVI